MAPFAPASPRLPRSTHDPRSYAGQPVRSSRLRPCLILPIICAAFLLFPHLFPIPPSGSFSTRGASPGDPSLDAPSALAADDDRLSPDAAFEPSFRAAKDHIGKASSHFMKALEHHLNEVGARVGVKPGARVGGSEAYVTDKGYLHYPAPNGVGTAAGSGGGVRHPISWLIEEAERKWEGMLARQSITLEESVKEYRRRYARAPPRGYELWQVEWCRLASPHGRLTTFVPWRTRWQYAVKHDIIMKDECQSVPSSPLSPPTYLPPPYPAG